MESFAAQAAAADSQDLKLRIERGSVELAELDGQMRVADEEAGGQRKVLAQLMCESSSAAEAAQEAEGALALISEDAREYARLEACRLVLLRAMEDYRKRNQNPVLAQAGRFFGRLTGGAFSRLDADYLDEAQVLLAVRQDGSRVQMDGLSEGTCDQLYLALRLGHLAHRLDGGEAPFPLILDDILVNFDDARAAATLAALAEIATRTQVILFTHHRHVLSLARQAVGEQLNVLSLAGR